MRLAAGIAAAALVADQASKAVVLYVLDLPQRLAIDVLPPFFNLRMAWNFGVNFGLFARDSDAVRWTLIAVALAICALVWRWCARDVAAGRAAGRRVWPMQAATGLLVGGALGNVIDRLVHGAVADFINMSCCGIDNPFAFNVADAAIFAGALGLILFSGAGSDAPPGNKTP